MLFAVAGIPTNLLKYRFTSHSIVTLESIGPVNRYQVYYFQGDADEDAHIYPLIAPEDCAEFCLLLDGSDSIIRSTLIRRWPRHL